VNVAKGKSIRSTGSTLAGARTEFWVLLTVAAIVVFYGVVYPNAGLIAESLQGPNGITGSLYAEALGYRSTRDAIEYSLLLSLTTVAGSALVGVPLAILFDRVDVPGTRIFAACAVSPLLLPPLVGTIAFVFLFGDSGIATRLCIRIFNLAQAPYHLRGFWAVLAFHVYTIFPYFFIFVRTALRRVDPSLEEAGRMLGAGPMSRFTRILLPSLRGALAAAAILSFMTSMASFSAPYLFGGGLRVLTLEIYNAKVNNDRPLALVQTVILATLSLAAVALFARTEAAANRTGTKGSPARRVAVGSPLVRALATSGGLAVSFLLLLPHLTIGLIGFANVPAWTTEILPHEYTLANYSRLFTDLRFLTPVFNSLWMSALSAVAAFVLGLAAAYLISRYRFRGRTATTILLLVPWALPGTVLAYQVVESFGRASYVTAGMSLAGSTLLLPLIYLLRNLPLVFRAALVNLDQLDRELESAARSLGATWLATMRRVVIPLVLPGAMAGAILAFSLALGEFVASIVAYVYSNRPISIQIEQSMRQGDLGMAAAYGTILIVMVGLALTRLGGSESARANI